MKFGSCLICPSHLVSPSIAHTVFHLYTRTRTWKVDCLKEGVAHRLSLVIWCSFSFPSHTLHVFFPTCQVRVVRFYVSCLTGRVPRQTSTASAGWQRSPPHLNRQLWMAVFPAGPQLRVPLGSFPARPQPPAPAGSVPLRTS